MKFISMNELDLNNKTVLIREDLNVPIIDGIITSEQRLISAMPTIKLAIEKGAGVIIMSHLGRPNEGEFDPKFSLKPVADYLTDNLDYPVRFASDYLDHLEVKPGEIVLCENVRFNVGEKANDKTLSQKIASLCDIFIMDAFGTAHRAHASTYGVAQYAKVVAAGPLLIRELEVLGQVFKSPEHPIVAIVGGSKISTKLTLLKHMINNVDILIPGGGIANTFLKALGHEIGKSLYEDKLLDEAREIIALAAQSGCEIRLPKDVVVGKEFSDLCPAFTKSLTHIASDDMIMDVGPETIKSYQLAIDEANTIIWNGPIGVFEFPQFTYGTRALAIAISHSEAFSIAGGGDTLAAIDQYNLTDDISYISTGGGAFLEFMEGRKLPAVDILEQRATKK